jgi:crotonobetainyl-CoA:carnitine CoA-transferase CaiB-like acyl-CoA transferase
MKIQPPIQESARDQSTHPASALEGVRVLDFSHALAGPYCTLLLADYGASVFKLESPEGGELARGWGPPFAGDQASFFLGLNRGKRGISIDMKRPEGIDLCLKLLKQMDVLVENFRPGTMERLGLGYEVVHARNPRLVYCSISGYGRNGPARDEAAMDLIVECSTGYLSVTGTAEGEQVRSGHSVADITAGMFAVIGTLTALRHRDRTGVGQFVDVSMFDGLISAMTSNYMTYFGSGQVPKPLGTSFTTIVPYRVFHAADQAFSIAVASDKLWSAFCEAIGHSELLLDSDYVTNSARVQNRRRLEEFLDATFRARPAAEWLDRLGKAGIPCSLVLTLSEVLAHPQAAFREMFPCVEHPTAGRHRVTGSPVKMSETPSKPTTAAPLLGEHTREVLGELLELNLKTIDELAANGIIFNAPTSLVGHTKQGPINETN